MVVSENFFSLQSKPMFTNAELGNGLTGLSAAHSYIL